jgi:hypothetical protein
MGRRRVSKVNNRPTAAGKSVPPVSLQPCVFPGRCPHGQRGSKRWQRTLARIPVVRPESPGCAVPCWCLHQVHSGAPVARLAVSQFPRRMPLDATPFTRVIPLASSDASRPLSGLDGQLPHRRDAKVYGDGTQPAGFQRDAPSGRGRLGEAPPRSWPCQAKHSSRPRL